MSKLIVNTGTLAAGGAERVLSILSKTLADAFDEVQYVLWLDAKYPDIFYSIDPRIKIVKISRESGSTHVWYHMLWYRNYIKNEKPTIVLSFMVMVCFTVTVSLFFTGIKQIVAERNDPRFFSRKWLRKIIDLSYRSHDVKGILMQTEWNRRYFSKSKLLKKTSVIYNPIILNKEAIGSSLECEKENIIVSVGRLTKQKRHDILINAFAILHMKYPKYKLIIYGEGEERAYLQALVDKLQLVGCVELPGRIKDVTEKINHAIMFVMTSDYEGMSNALAEAMCLGLPCISTKVSGATDLIKNGNNGFLVEVGDTTAVTEKMLLLINDENLRKSISSNAYLVYDALRCDVVGNQWVDYIRSIIK